MEYQDLSPAGVFSAHTAIQDLTICLLGNLAFLPSAFSFLFSLFSKITFFRKKSFRNKTLLKCQIAWTRIRFAVLSTFFSMSKPNCVSVPIIARSAAPDMLP